MKEEEEEDDDDDDDDEEIFLTINGRETVVMHVTNRQ